MEQNKARELIGVSIIKSKVRVCLACDKEFYSVAEERLCGCTQVADFEKGVGQNSNKIDYSSSFTIFEGGGILWEQFKGAKEKA